MGYPVCPECNQSIKISKVKRVEKNGYCYHQCYKCDQIFSVTPS